MKNENALDFENYTIVRYNKVYFIITIIAVIIITAFFLHKPVVDAAFIIWIFLIAILLIRGIRTLRGRIYIKHNKQNKIFIIDSSLGFREGKLTYYRKYKYDRIYFTGEGASKSLYIEINGKKKYINMSKWSCNKLDYEIFYKEITG